MRSTHDLDLLIRAGGVMRSMTQIWITAAFALLAPAAAEACQGLRTYDFGKPGASPDTRGNTYWYFIGRVVSVQREQNLEAGFSAKVHFEILTDYRYQNRATTLTALVKSNRCVGLPILGSIGKFAVDEHSGVPVLAHTPSSL